MDEDLNLDGLFAQARQNVPLPSQALLARIEADAAREQPRPVPLVQAPVAKPRGWGLGLFLADLLGGRSGMAGLTLAAASGLWLGVAQPAALLSVTQIVTGASASAAVELMPSDSSLFAEAELFAGE